MYSEVTVTEWVQFNQKSGSFRICQQKSTTEKFADVCLCAKFNAVCGLAYLVSMLHLSTNRATPSSAA